VICGDGQQSLEGIGRGNSVEAPKKVVVAGMLVIMMVNMEAAKVGFDEAVAAAGPAHLGFGVAAEISERGVADLLWRHGTVSLRASVLSCCRA
jgi:hypothetical protein